LLTCHQESFQKLKKYTSGLIVVMILWFTIGFLFCKKYLPLPIAEDENELSTWLKCTAVAVAFVYIVIQIEKQIILSSKGGILWVRVLIAVCMAFLGAIVINPIIFAEDIEIVKNEQHIIRRDSILSTFRTECEKLSESKLKYYSDKIDSLNNKIYSIDRELYKQKPFISLLKNIKKGEEEETTYGTFANSTIDRLIGDRTEAKEEIKHINDEIKEEWNKIDSCVEQKKNELDSLGTDKKGILHDMRILWSLILEKGNGILRTISCVLTLLLFSLEIFVLLIKWEDKDCMYELKVRHQLEMGKRGLENLKESTTFVSS
jgi:hypothetical protein